MNKKIFNMKTAFDLNNDTTVIIDYYQTPMTEYIEGRTVYKIVDNNMVALKHTIRHIEIIERKEDDKVLIHKMIFSDIQRIFECGKGILEELVPPGDRSDYDLF